MFKNGVMALNFGAKALSAAQKPLISLQILIFGLLEVRPSP